VGEAASGQHIVLNKNGMIVLYDKDGRELERHTVPLGSILAAGDGAAVKKGASVAKWDPYNVPILSEFAGQVDVRDFIVGVTVRKEKDEATGMEDLVILEHREEIHPQLLIRDPADPKKILGAYTMPAGAHVVVEKGDEVYAGAVIAKTPRKQARTKDITGGLPRVAELFEARKPKDAAEIAKIDGIVEMGGNARGRRKLLVRDPITGDAEEHLIPLNKHIVAYAGDRVKKGQPLTEGPVVPQEILEVCGPQELQEYLVNEVQEVYRLQGVEINDKHIEIIVRQMLRKVRISEPGDTGFLWGEQVEKQAFLEVNRKVAEEGRKPAEATPLLLGITKASLETESFISAASFQDTTRVLTDAATLARVDNLHGFKENVIMGHVIPAGTGFSMYRNIKLVPLAEPISAEELIGDQLGVVPASEPVET
jgi:DNA-directed RNA polymerase subunit beta'